ncbi:PREDICTED: syntaxin-5 [Haliaeetus leucocephalus]|uniref:syntaxin-5 n=1 Tax=Haliaeetus leucocephalus TaxID=52644 RepID=UPI00053CEC91|nr:PREDICTED: syntaxin-5 [Haliaeetus leucocephalus]
MAVAKGVAWLLGGSATSGALTGTSVSLEDCRPIEFNFRRTEGPVTLSGEGREDVAVTSARPVDPGSGARPDPNPALFDDKAVEIEELTYIIKQDINSLNKQIAQLQEVVRARGGQSGRHVQTHSNTVVVSLQSKLASMSNDFKSVLEVRTENLKQQRSRREHFSRAPVSALPLAASNLGSSAVLQDEPQRAGAVAIEMDARTSQQLQLIDEQDSYIQSRADTMQNIESTIVELGSIFQQLAHMVKEQEETIQRIDASVEDAQLNVEAAHGEILKYFQSVTSNRWLMVKIFLILIVFFIVFVVFLA